MALTQCSWNQKNVASLELFALRFETLDLWIRGKSINQRSSITSPCSHVLEQLKELTVRGSEQLQKTFSVNNSIFISASMSVPCQVVSRIHFSNESKRTTLTIEKNKVQKQEAHLGSGRCMCWLVTSRRPSNPELWEECERVRLSAEPGRGLRIIIQQQQLTLNLRFRLKTKATTADGKTLFLQYATTDKRDIRAWTRTDRPKGNKSMIASCTSPPS